MHSDLEDRFPMAMAAGEVGDEDPQEDERLEKHGEALGKNKERFQKKAVTSEGQGTQLSLASKHDQHSDGARKDPQS
jgi:hypothetical protein